MIAISPKWISDLLEMAVSRPFETLNGSSSFVVVAVTPHKPTTLVIAYTFLRLFSPATARWLYYLLRLLCFTCI
jgi:hypothetical protein